MDLVLVLELCEKELQKFMKLYKLLSENKNQSYVYPAGQRWLDIERQNILRLRPLCNFLHIFCPWFGKYPQKICFYEGILFVLLDEISGHGNLFVLRKFIATTGVEMSAMRRNVSGVNRHVVHDFEYLIDQLLVSTLNKILESKLIITLISLLRYIF